MSAAEGMDQKLAVVNKEIGPYSKEWIVNDVSVVI
jgi:hypothetical protein